MKNSIAMSMLLAASLLPLHACGAAQGEAEPARVWFLSPEEGEQVTGSEVVVRFGSSGVRVTSADVHEPGTGHHHLFVNRDVTPLGEEIPAGVTGILHFGQGQTEFLLTDLEPGEHRLIAVIADYNHVPLNPPAVDTVRFTVVAPSGNGG